MAYHVYLAEDPVIGPTHGQKTGSNSSVYYKSVDITGATPPNPPSFKLVFLRSEIDGDYNAAASTPSVTGTRPGTDALGNPINIGIRTFSSSKVGSHHQVKIKLNGATKNSYKYDVDMSGKTWDPRVVPL